MLAAQVRGTPYLIVQQPWKFWDVHQTVFKGTSGSTASSAPQQSTPDVHRAIERFSKNDPMIGHAQTANTAT